MSSHDILVSGGGVAGLTAAAAFGAAGFSVLVVDPAPPVTDAAKPGADLRTTAFLQPARQLMERAGLWEALAPHAMELATMRIVDAGGRDGGARVVRDFLSHEVTTGPFGWNLPNWLLRREISARLAAMENVTFRPGCGFRSMVARQDEVLVRLSDDTGARVRLVVGADGRNSAVRTALGIKTTVLRYGQKAVVFAVTHDEPHGGMSTEVHRAGGPFTLVPLPDLDGQPCSSVVWMESGPEAQRLAALPEAAFSAAATERSGGIYGPLQLAAKRQVWPIISQIAHGLTGPRAALVAEAAHVVPPIGAQGLNMSLADITCLLDLAIAHRRDPGSRAALDAYARRRLPEVALRVTGVDLLNRASMAGAQPLRDLRAAGIRMLHGAAPVRRGLMRLGLGARG